MMDPYTNQFLNQPEPVIYLRSPLISALRRMDYEAPFGGMPTSVQRRMDDFYGTPNPYLNMGYNGGFYRPMQVIASPYMGPMY